MKDISKLDRNLERLIKEVAKVCQRIFASAGLGVGRHVTIDRRTRQPTKAESNGKEAGNCVVRERTTIQVREFVISFTQNGAGRLNVVRYIGRCCDAICIEFRFSRGGI